MPDPIISIPWTDDSLTVLDFNKVKVNGELVTGILTERDGLRARVASLEETARLNAEEYIKAQAETTRWAARCGVEKGKREQAEARVAELEALHKTYYNQPFAEACQRAASEERERIISKFLERAEAPDYAPGEIVLARWDGAGLDCLTTPDEIRFVLNPKA